MTTSQILGFMGTGLVIGGCIPQIVHLVKERLHSRHQHPGIRSLVRSVSTSASNLRSRSLESVLRGQYSSHLIRHAKLVRIAP